MKKKYLFMTIASLIAAGISMLLDEITTEEHIRDVAEEAAKKAVHEYKKSNEKQGNRAQRRAAR